MLVLNRKEGEKIVIGGGITICFLGMHRDEARIGIEAPEEVSINRKEIQDKIDEGNASEGRNTRKGKAVISENLKSWRNSRPQ